MSSPLIVGFLASFALIAAIGAQNAFVLRQGIRREHVLPVVAMCTVSDIVLIAAGMFRLLGKTVGSSVGKTAQSMQTPEGAGGGAGGGKGAQHGSSGGTSGAGGGGGGGGSGGVGNESQVAGQAAVGGAGGDVGSSSGTRAPSAEEGAATSNGEAPKRTAKGTRSTTIDAKRGFAFFLVLFGALILIVVGYRARAAAKKVKELEEKEK